MDTEKTRAEVLSGKCFLGIEFGSTRIKAVLTAEDLEPLAQGSFSWQDSLKDGVWTYDLDDAAAGLSECYLDLKKDLRGRGLPVPEKLAGIGVSAMMHGYIARDKEGKLLVPFRTWRNTITGQAAEKLTELFGFNIPQRWSIAHLCQAVLNKEEHIERLDSVTTLASYIHELLTGRKVIGADDASGMIPLAADRSGYDPVMAEKFEKLTGLDIFRLFPKVLPAGEEAGRLTEAGALMIDPEGDLKSGIPLCPPEGDAGTGMVATASVRPRTGNVSAGTSIFSMIVLEELPKKVHPEIDIVTTPSGEPVAMVHCNTCSSDINAWVGLFSQVLKAAGKEPDMGALYETLFKKAMEAKDDCGGIINYNFFSGEPVLSLGSGFPAVIREPDAPLDLPEFMRALLYSSFAALCYGNRILEKDGVQVDKLTGHGGMFKTPGTVQKLMASALGTPVAVMKTAGEGGPWGSAILAAYMARRDRAQSLEDFTDEHVLAASEVVTEQPDGKIAAGFDKYMESYLSKLDMMRRS